MLCFQLYFYIINKLKNNKKMKKIYTALLALGLAITANAQTTFKLDSTFNSDGIYSTNGTAGNNASAYANGCILNNDGSVWLSGSLNGAGNSSWTHYIARLTANGTADNAFCNVGAAGYTWTNWASMGNLLELYPTQNGGVYAPHTGYGGFSAASATSTTISKENYDDFGNNIEATAQVNDSVIVELTTTNEIYTYKHNSGNAYGGAYWFNSGSSYGGSLPASIFPTTIYGYTGVATQSNQKVLLYGWIDSSNFHKPFIMRLKKNSYSELDSTFGTNGISYVPNNVFAYTEIKASYVQNDDKIILHNAEYFMRLKADGTYDNGFGYFRIDVATGSTTIWANAYKFVTNSTNTELYGITRNVVGDHMVFAAYTNGTPMNSFHKGENHIAKWNQEVDYSFLELYDISINNNNDLLVAGIARKTATTVIELFAMKLKKGTCNAITATTQQINDTTINVTVAGTNATPIKIYYLLEHPGTTISSGNSGNIIVQPGQTYTLTIVDANGCQGTKVVNAYAMAMNNHVQNTTFNIYPNPASDIVTFALPQLSNNATISIISIDGKIMQHNLITTNSIDISALNSGIYFLQIKDGLQQYSAKFIKE
jgi:Secretion system C-terminal sorting domain